MRVAVASSKVETFVIRSIAKKCFFIDSVPGTSHILALAFGDLFHWRWVFLVGESSIRCARTRICEFLFLGLAGIFFLELVISVRINERFLVVFTDILEVVSFLEGSITLLSDWELRDSGASEAGGLVELVPVRMGRSRFLLVRLFVLTQMHIFLKFHELFHFGLGFYGSHILSQLDL